MINIRNQKPNLYATYSLPVLAMSLLAGCNDPLRLIEERPGDLPARLSADRARQVQPLTLDQFKAMPAPAGETPAELQAITARRAAMPKVQWSIEQVRSWAIARNLDLRASVVEPAIAEQRVNEQRAKFDQVFRPTVRYINADRPTQNITSANTQEILSTEAAIDIPLRTGGRATISIDPSWSSTNNPFFAFPESYSADLVASISVPLMRGQGREINAASIKIAAYQADIASTSTRLALTNILASVDRAYWRLFAANQELSVRQQQYELAQAQLQRAQRRVNAGDAAQIEVTRAQSGLASRMEGIITAETSVLTAQRELKRLIDATAVSENVASASSEAFQTIDDKTLIITATTPAIERYELSPENLIELASSNRAEILQAELQILADALNVDLARDATRPQIDLQASNEFGGIGPGLDDVSKNIANRRFQTWSIALTGSVPISNDAAESNLRASALTRLQRIYTLESRKSTIRQEVLDAIDRVASGWQRILASQQSSVLAATTLEAESRQFDAGLRTSTDVLDAASRLADAQSAEVRAITDYRLAIVDLALATGTTLGSGNIVFEPLTEPTIEGSRWSIDGLRVPLK